MQVDTQQSVQGEVVVFDLLIGFVDTAVGCLDDGHGVLRDRVRGISGNAQYSDAVFLGGLEVNIVEAGAAQEDQADTAVVQDFNDFTGSFVINEDADRVKALGKLGRLNGQTAVEIFNFSIIGTFTFFPGQFAEENTVVIFGTKESDFQNRDSLVLGGDVLKNIHDFGRAGLFVSTFNSDFKGLSFRGVEGHDLQDIVAGSFISVAFKGCYTFELYTGLRQQSGGTRMDSKGIGDEIAELFHGGEYLLIRYKFYCYTFYPGYTVTA